jgi:glycosyltransferase involved in cell wall biosynthesis
MLYMFYQSGIEGKANIDVFTPIREMIRNSGHDVHLVSQNDCEPYEIKEKGSIIVHPLLPKIPILFVATLFLVFRLRQLCCKIQPDLILSSADWNVPIIGFALSKLLRRPMVLVFRGLPLEGVYYNQKTKLPFRLASLFLLKLNLAITRRTKHIIAISPGIKIYCETGLGRKDCNLINLECVNPEEFKPLPRDAIRIKEKFGIAKDELVLLYSGAIEQYRRIDRLVDAFAYLKRRYGRLKVVILGYGSQKRQLIEEVKRQGWSQYFLFPSWIPREDMPRVISIADICVDTYPRSYWPIFLTPSDKLIEYMSCEKCIVSNNVQGHAFLLKNGHNGLLYSTNATPTQLANELDRLLQSDEIRRRLAMNARNTVLSDYNAIKVAPIFEGFCFDVLRDSLRQELLDNL